MKEKERVVSILREHLEGLTQIQIIRKSKLSQYKVVKILGELKGEDKIKVMSVGNANLHVWRTK